MRIKPVILIFILSAWASSLIAQTKSLQTVKRAKKPPKITEEFSIGARLNSDGWGGYAERAFINTYNKKTSFVWMGISEKKHPKETKQLNEAYRGPNQELPLPYKYGKINNFYQLKFGYGQKKKITGMLDKKSVVVSWVYAGGLSLGFTKPYHLVVNIQESNGLFRQEIVDYYETETQDIFLDEAFIFGGTYFTEGIANININPGLVARSGFYFDYSFNKKSYVGVEIGTSLEVYPKVIPIMANTDNNAFFLNLYVDVRFGKRWSRGSLD